MNATAAAATAKTAAVWAVYLHVSGAPKVLPDGVEVSAYRSLEHLLDAYGDPPGQRIDVSVEFAAEVLSLSVRGPRPPAVAVQSALASARARVDVHHGSLSSSYPGQQWETILRLPLGDGG